MAGPLSSNNDSRLLSPSNHSSQNDSTTEKYVKYVELCYRRRPEAAAYYQRLTDYLLTRPFSANQIPSDLKAYDFAKHQINRTVSQNLGKTFMPVGLQTPRHGPRLFVGRGFPAPEAVSMLGAQLSLPPEFFLGHLDFSQCKKQYQPLYELPTVPSRQRNIAHVRLVTLAKERNESETLRSLAARRTFAEQKTQEFEYQLYSDKRYGATRFRRTNVHNSRVFSVEQTVSICVMHDEQKGWSSMSIDRFTDPLADFSEAIVLQDQGHSLQPFRDLPWSSCSNVEFIHTIPYNDAPVSNDSVEPVSSRDCPRMHSLHPYDPVVDWYTTCPEDQELIARDPFFLVGQLLLTSALSWNQSLNFVEENIRGCQFAFSKDADLALEQLRYNISFVDRARSYLRDNLAAIDQASFQPQTCLNDELLEKAARKNRDMLIKDHEWIINRCNSLISRCEVISGSLMSMASLEASQRSIQESYHINRLTKLAFIFIPMSFTASVFGMNVAEMAKNPSIWVFFLVAAPVVGLTCLAMNWEALCRILQRRRWRMMKMEDWL